MSSELEDVRLKGNKSRREVRQLEKALAKARGELLNRERVRSPSVGSFLDSAQEKTLAQEEGKGGWVMWRKNGGEHVCASKGDGVKRAAATSQMPGVNTDGSRIPGERCGDIVASIRFGFPVAFYLRGEVVRR